MGLQALWDNTKKLFVEDGEPKIGNIALAGAGLYGLSRLDNSNTIQNFLGGGEQQKTGYQDGIPNYIATRAQVPGAFSSVLPNTPAGSPPVARRPGLSGRRYFTDTNYAADPNAPIMGRTAEQLAAENTRFTEDQALAEQILQTYMGGMSTYQPPGAGGTDTADADWLARSANFTDAKWQNVVDTWAAQNPNATRAQIDSALAEFRVPTHLFPYVYTKMGINTTGGTDNTGGTNNTGTAADAAWMESSKSFSDDKWRQIMDAWVAQNPNATKAQVDSALIQFGVPSNLYGYAYSKSNAINDPLASQGLGKATADTGFLTPNAPTGPGGKDLYDMLRETISYAASNNPAGQGIISKSEADQIYDIAKTLGMSIPQITEIMNLTVPSLGITAGKVAEGINWVAPDEAEDYFSLVGSNYDPNKRYAAGGKVGAGIGTLPQSRGYYLGGATDGMADKVPASIGGRQEAALSHGEFVMPADIVSHLGNGNSEAGAKVLYDMMDRVRKARTGSPEQGRQINPTRFTPA